MTPAEDTRMYLQRKLPAGDSARWRTVLRFGHDQIDDVDELLVVAKRIEPDLQWRITAADGQPLA